MNKQATAERKIRTVIIRRNNDACRQAHVNASCLRVADEQMQLALAKCTNQAQVIDLALRNSMTVSNTADALVMLNLCTSYDAAIARIKRHMKHDETSRIIKRTVIMTQALQSRESIEEKEAVNTQA
jgi:hypothetical protein